LRDASTGKRFEFTGIVFWRAHEGKIVERWAEVEFSALIAQLSSPEAT
jgi:predicted ester cyclase